MEPVLHHSWDCTPREAVELQKQLAGRVLLKNVKPLSRLRFAAGLDVSYSRLTRKSYAVVVVFDMKTRDQVTSATAVLPTRFPYIPGLLSFREIPALAAALSMIDQPIDILICDGQGIAHPRGMGLATHLGILYDIPSIGCAKSILIGEPAGTLPPEQGAWVYLRHPRSRRSIGILLRTRTRCHPVVISPGHKVTLAGARRVTGFFVDRYRIPEIIRKPHIVSGILRKKDHG